MYLVILGCVVMKIVYKPYGPKLAILNCRGSSFPVTVFEKSDDNKYYGTRSVVGTTYYVSKSQLSYPESEVIT